MLILLLRRQDNQYFDTVDNTSGKTQGWGQVAETSYTMCPSEYVNLWFWDLENL